METARRWQMAIVLLVSVLASSTTFAQSPSTLRDQAAVLTRELLAAQAELQSSADPAAALARLSTLAEERRSAMAALLATEPASFLSLAISSEERDALPVSIRNLTEERTEIEGDFEVMVEDYDWGAITRYHVRTQERGRLALHFATDAPALLTDQRVRIRGVVLGDDLVVASGTLDVQPLTSVLPSTFGEQRTVMILVNFTDLTTQPFSLATASDLLFNTVNSFYRENSQNQTWLGGDVVGWFTIGMSSTACDYTAIENRAKAAATGAGVDLSRYRRVIISFPKNSCSWSGLGYVGGSNTTSWINGSMTTRTVGHELGHNLGLNHAHALECGNATLGSSCSTVDYGNPVDIMGMPGFVGHFNAFAKERLGWLDYGTSAPLLKVTSAGTFTISPYASTLSGMKALKILKSVSSTGVPTYYYVEHRHGANFDSSVPAGVFVHTGVDGDGDTSFVLDMTPETDSWSDAALPTGRTFTDAASGVSITTMSVSSTGATVRIDFGGPLPCSYSLSAASQSMSAAGGSGSVNLTTSSSCAWSASSNASWLTPSASSGTGSATVQYSVAANTTSSARTGTITIGGQPFTVTQATSAQTCSYSLNSSSQSMGAAGGSGSVNLTTSSSCAWGTTSNASWLTPSVASGTGSATVQYTVAANTTSSARTGTITIGGQPFTVTQAAGAQTCSYSLNSSSQSMGAAGGSGSVNLTTSSSCAWGTTSNASWLTPSVANGTGSATVQYSVAANTTSIARTGTITIGGQPFTVTQATAGAPENHAPSLAPLAAQKVPEGGTMAFTISGSDPDGDTLTYSASNLPSGAVLNAGTGAFQWTPTSGQAGNYNVTFSVSDGQLSASQTVKLTVSGPNRKAQFGVLADLANEEGDAVMLTIVATDPDGDALTFSANGLPAGLVIDPISAIVSGVLRDGSAGVYGITISAFDGELTSDATFTWTIRQRPPVPCTFTLSAATASIPAGGGSGVVGVHANAASCTWAATSGASWLTVTAGASGSGDSTVKFAVERNDGVARSGGLTIAGLLFTVSQDAQAAGCAVTVTPSMMNAPALGGSGEFAVAADCPWSVTSDSAWLTVTSATGVGNGTVVWAALANETPAIRTGTLRIGDTNVVVTQSTARDGVPQDLKVQVNGTQLVLTWQPGRAVAVQEYIVEIGSATGLADVAAVHTGTPSPQLVADSVAPGTYYVRVRGVASWGVTEASDELVVTINDGEALAAPREVSARVSGGTLSLMWLPPASGSAPSGYVIEAGSAPGAHDLASIATGTAATSFVTPGVPPGRYYVRLRSAAGGRTSAPSEEITVTIGTSSCTVAPTAPSSLQSMVVGGQLTLTWAAPAGGEGATSYQIEAGSAPGLSNLGVLDTGSPALQFVASAPPGVYYVRIKARNACGVSVASAAVTIVVQP